MVVFGGVLTKDLVALRMCVHADGWCYMCVMCMWGGVGLTSVHLGLRHAWGVA